MPSREAKEGIFKVRIAVSLLFLAILISGHPTLSQQTIVLAINNFGVAGAVAFTILYYAVSAILLPTFVMWLIWFFQPFETAIIQSGKRR